MEVLIQFFLNVLQEFTLIFLQIMLGFSEVFMQEMLTCSEFYSMYIALRILCRSLESPKFLMQESFRSPTN